MNGSELLQLAKGWGNFSFYRVIIWRLRSCGWLYRIYPIETAWFL